MRPEQVLPSSDLCWDTSYLSQNTVVTQASSPISPVSWWRRDQVCPDEMLLRVRAVSAISALRWWRHRRMLVRQRRDLRDGTMAGTNFVADALNTVTAYFSPIERVGWRFGGFQWMNPLMLGVFALWGNGPHPWWCHRCLRRRQRRRISRRAASVPISLWRWSSRVHLRWLDFQTVVLQEYVADPSAAILAAKFNTAQKSSFLFGNWRNNGVRAPGLRDDIILAFRGWASPARWSRPCGRVRVRWLQCQYRLLHRWSVPRRWLSPGCISRDSCRRCAIHARCHPVFDACQSGCNVRTGIETFSELAARYRIDYLNMGCCQ